MAVALIPAAGSGERLGAERPKALVELGGRPLISWSLDVLSRVGAIERIVVALPAGALQLPWAPAQTLELVSVAGGATRSESVRNALAAAGESEEVLVHDAARPLLTARLVEDTLAALAQEGVDGAVAAARVTDTIKEASKDGTVARTLARSTLWAAQTPQAFRRGALEHALTFPRRCSRRRRTMPGCSSARAIAWSSWRRRARTSRSRAPSTSRSRRRCFTKATERTYAFARTDEERSDACRLSAVRSVRPCASAVAAIHRSLLGLRRVFARSSP